ncbi:MAG TPA: response regulator [Candidatus Acidoferrales bacterium]|nr:response regulator [Candidatus Acidoferrales bacterium]
MTPSTACASGAKILVIDDNPIIQRTLYFALRDQGYSVLMCGEIAAALKIIREQRLDVILLDLNFPLDASIGSTSMRDGFWVLDWVRRLDEAGNIHVIVVSGDPPEKSKAHALASGAAAYFHKPVDKRELTETIAAMLAAKPALSPHPNDPTSQPQARAAMTNSQVLNTTS